MTQCIAAHEFFFCNLENTASYLILPGALDNLAAGISSACMTAAGHGHVSVHVHVHKALGCNLWLAFTHRLPRLSTSHSRLDPESVKGFVKCAERKSDTYSISLQPMGSAEATLTQAIVSLHRVSTLSRYNQQANQDTIYAGQEDWCHLKHCQQPQQ